MKTLIGTAPERPDYERAARVIHALAVKARETLRAAGRLAGREAGEPEGR